MCTFPILFNYPTFRVILNIIVLISYSTVCFYQDLVFLLSYCFYVCVCYWSRVFHLALSIFLQMI